MSEEIKNYIISSCLYQEEIDSFNELSKQEQEKLKKRAKEIITEFDMFENKLIKEMGTDILAIAFTSELEDLDETTIYDFYSERGNWYFDSKRFFEKSESKELFEEYGVLPVDKKGEYLTIGDYNYISKNIIKRQFKNISSKTEEEAEKIMRELWEDRTQFLTDEKLRDLSKTKNGIGFKEFLFCEEYIKTGKVTKTCESLGIGRATCYDYLKKPEVKVYLEERKEEIKKESDNLLKKGFNDCFSELHRLVTEKSFIQDHDKIKAIDCYLRHYEQCINKETN